MANGRDQLPWDSLTWDRIDQAVAEECQRTKLAARFLPPYPGGSAELLTIPSDTVASTGQPLTVNQTQKTDIVEISVQFKLTKQQVAGEKELMTAVTLATRAANLLSQAEDVLIFQGKSAVTTHPLFALPNNKVTVTAGSDPGTGLLDPTTVIQDVPLADSKKPKLYGEQTTGAVFAAYSQLQKQAHYGPYALVLHHEPFADTHRPLEKTLIMPSDRIKPLMTEGYFGTGTLPLQKGILVSLGGNTMDLVMAQSPMIDVLIPEADGWLFKVYERFALRLKDPTAVIQLNFV